MAREDREQRRRERRHRDRGGGGGGDRTHKKRRHKDKDRNHRDRDRDRENTHNDVDDVPENNIVEDDEELVTNSNSNNNNNKSSSSNNKANGNTTTHEESFLTNDYTEPTDVSTLHDRELAELQLLCDGATSDDMSSWEKIRRWLRNHSVDDARAAAERRGDYETTPLHLACRNCPPLDIVNMLLTASPKTVELADSFGWLPLHYGKCIIMIYIGYLYSYIVEIAKIVGGGDILSVRAKKMGIVHIIMKGYE